MKRFKNDSSPEIFKKINIEGGIFYVSKHSTLLRNTSLILERKGTMISQILNFERIPFSMIKIIEHTFNLNIKRTLYIQI